MPPPNLEGITFLQSDLNASSMKSSHGRRAWASVLLYPPPHNE